MSVLAGEASSKLALGLGHHAAMDCRISQLPTDELVLDYFRWRQEDAHRNAISAHCYWRLRDSGLSARQATAELEGRSVSQKNELLFQHGINVAELPAWQKCGTGLWWHQIEKVGQNPRTGEEVTTTRRRLRANSELPYGEAYAVLVREILTTSVPTSPSRR